METFWSWKLCAGGFYQDMDKDKLPLKQALLSPSIPKCYLLKTLPPAEMLLSQLFPFNVRASPIGLVFLFFALAVQWIAQMA